jgi:hypothetical protein
MRGQHRRGQKMWVDQKSSQRAVGAARLAIARFIAVRFDLQGVSLSARSTVAMILSCARGLSNCLPHPIRLAPHLVVEWRLHRVANDDVARLRATDRRGRVFQSAWLRCAR